MFSKNCQERLKTSNSIKYNLFYNNINLKRNKVEKSIVDVFKNFNAFILKINYNKKKTL